jgi:hypothetical protein
MPLRTDFINSNFCALSRQGYKARGFHLPSPPAAQPSTPTIFFRTLNEASKNAESERVTHLMLVCTCSTFMTQLTTVKNVQAHFRHSTSPRA